MVINKFKKQTSELHAQFESQYKNQSKTVLENKALKTKVAVLQSESEDLRRREDVL